MSLKAGIVGLPNVGKSTLFSAITNNQTLIANYPFATIEPNIGIVTLQDERLTKLNKIVETKKITPAIFEFVDIAGLVKGASKGEGLGNKFINNIRNTDLIIHVVRCFEDKNVINTQEGIDVVRDINIINDELIFADLVIVEKLIAKTKKLLLVNKTDELEKKIELLNKFLITLSSGKLLNKLELDENEKIMSKQWQLVTIKPLILVGNINNNFIIKPLENKYYASLVNYAKNNNIEVLEICANLEYEISLLKPSDKQAFMLEYKINELGLEKLAKTSFEILELATYFTVGEKEIRAWTFKKGSNAKQCAGIIHSDFERGFIKAEIVSYQDFISNNGYQGAKNNGKIRMEGKDYKVLDGDIILFKFNV